jgi:hypothetical protein
MHKYTNRITGLIIFIAVFTVSYLLIPIPQIKQAPTTPNPTSTTQTNEAFVSNTTLTQAPVHTIQTATPPSPITDTKTPTSTPTTTTSPIPNQSTPFTLTIDGKTITATTAQNSTVYDAMNELQKQKILSFTTKKFTGLGYFIESINGISNSPCTGYYWTLYINNEEAKVGVSNYIIKPNDSITWKFENK